MRVASGQGPVAPATDPSPPFDVLLRGGMVVDGTGAPGFRADVAMRGDRIVLISRAPLDSARATTVLDASGLVVAPGFIDLHAHVEELERFPYAENFLRQGVTTVVYAPDGRMPWPLATYASRLTAAGHAPNVAFFAGHATIRELVLGGAARAPGARELERMKALVAQAMQEGAVGLSTGLRYVPGAYAHTEEIVELARVVGGYGGVYASHIRDEGPGTVEAVAELIEVARAAGVPAHVSHHKLIGRAQWGQSARTLALVDSARAAGLDITLDQYPYTAMATSTAILFPSWALEGGTRSLRARLSDPARRRRIAEAIRETLVREQGAEDLHWIQLSRVRFRPSWQGRTFEDIARQRRREPDLDFAVEFAIELQAQGGAGAIWHVAHEEDVRRIMRHPWTMFASDGSLVAPGRGHPHPRSYGAFPRVLARYVREEDVLELEQAVRKMTSLPAWRIGQRERGRIAEGVLADVVVFDAGAVQDRGTFDEPHRYPEGIRHVLVNGTPVVRDGRLTGARPGRVLRRE